MITAPKTEFVFNENSRDLTGIYLAGDYTAEHEQGIARLQSLVGLTEDPSIMGIDRYRVPTPNEQTPIFFKSWEKPRAKTIKRFAALFIGNPWQKDRFDQCGENPPQRIYGAWDDQGMFVTCINDDVAHLQKIHEALLKGEACLFLGGGSKNPFDRGGIVLGIVNTVPKTVKEELKKTHENIRALEEATVATGITETLKNTGCRYYALKPDWTHNFKEVMAPGRSETRSLMTKHPVVFFLNPMDQKNNNFGWVTVEDLEDWAKGQGVIKKAS